MSDPTAYQRLDDAIHEFASSLDALGGTVSGWTLAYELSAVTTEPGMLPLIHRTGYTVGPGTSPATALGLHAGLAHFLAQQLTADLDPDQEGDDE